MGISQNIMHLLQSGQQDLPKLIKDLGISVVAAAVQLLRHDQQAAAQIDFFQESVQGKHLLPEVLCLPEPLAQPRQGR